MAPVAGLEAAHSLTATVRQRILDFVRKYPATHEREMERRLGLPDRLAAYHLTRLVEEGLVSRVREKGYNRYWLAKDRASARTLRLTRLLRRDQANKIMLLLLENDELSHGEVSNRLSLSKATTSYHLSRLKDAGLVKSRDDGRSRFYFAADKLEARRVLSRLPPLPGPVNEFSELWDDLLG